MILNRESSILNLLLKTHPPVGFALDFVSVLEETLTLNDALKLAGAAATGGQAKILIQSGQVKVNGHVETKRKRRLVAGDAIEVNGEEFVLDLQEVDPEEDDLELEE